MSCLQAIEDRYVYKWEISFFACDSAGPDCYWPNTWMVRLEDEEFKVFFASSHKGASEAIERAIAKWDARE